MTQLYSYWGVSWLESADMWLDYARQWDDRGEWPRAERCREEARKEEKLGLLWLSRASGAV